MRNARPLRAPLALAALAALAACTTLAAGCSRKHSVLSPQVQGVVTWNNTVFGLFRDRSTQTATVGCFGCHNGDPSIPDFTDYDNVVLDSSAVVIRLSPGGNMRGYLLAGEPETIIGWIHDGAPK